MIHEKFDDLRQFFSNMFLEVNFHKSCQIRHKFYNGQILNLKNVCISGWWDSISCFDEIKTCYLFHYKTISTWMYKL